MFRDELFQGRQLFPKRGDLGFGVGLFGPFVGHDFLGSRRNESSFESFFARWRGILRGIPVRLRVFCVRPRCRSCPPSVRSIAWSLRIRRPKDLSPGWFRSARGCPFSAGRERIPPGSSRRRSPGASGVFLRNVFCLRTLRTAVTTSFVSSNRPSDASSISRASGMRWTMIDSPALRGARSCQISSVTNGMKGCSRRKEVVEETARGFQRRPVDRALVGRFDHFEVPAAEVVPEEFIQIHEGFRDTVGGEVRFDLTQLSWRALDGTIRLPGGCFRFVPGCRRSSSR